MKPKPPLYERQNTALLATIAKYLCLYGIDKKKLATHVYVSLSTLYERLKEPGTFSLDEARRLADALRFTDEEWLALRRVPKGGNSRCQSA